MQLAVNEQRFTMYVAAGTRKRLRISRKIHLLRPHSADARKAEKTEMRDYPGIFCNKEKQRVPALAIQLIRIRISAILSYSRQLRVWSQ